MSAFSGKLSRGSIRPTRTVRKNRGLEDRDGGHIFTIGDLAREFDISLRTLRFYEDRGLITPRRSGTTRLYDEVARQRLSTILRGKSMGFTLTEIRAMLVAEGSGKSVTDLKLSKAQIDEQLKYLKRQKAEFETAITELKKSQKVAA